MPFFEERVKYVKICHQNSQNMKEYVKSPKICKKHIFLCIYIKCRALLIILRYFYKKNLRKNAKVLQIG